jgi:DNA replication protein DnaC
MENAQLSRKRRVSAVMSTLNPENTSYELGILTKSGVPPRYLSHSFENFRNSEKTSKAHEVATEWASLHDPKDRGFALLGAPGVGKTHLAVAAMREIARFWGDKRQGDESAGLYSDPKTMVEQRMRFINVPIFMDQLRASIKFSESKAQDLWDFAIDKASIIVLDDFGKERATDWVSERLYVLIESRYQNLRSTIVTSNRSLDELDDLGYGAAVSRLQETGRVVRIDEIDQRPKIGSQQK